MDNYKIVFTPTRFPEYLAPNGFFQDHPACHALWYYYILMRRNMFEDTEVARLEGHVEAVIQQRQIMKSVAEMYGVTPEQMVMYWSNIDLQCAVLQMEKLPAHFRFETIQTIN